MTRLCDLLWNDALASLGSSSWDQLGLAESRERFEAFVHARMRRVSPRGAKAWGEFVDAASQEARSLVSQARASTGIPSHRGTIVHPSIPNVPLDTSFS